MARHRAAVPRRQLRVSHPAVNAPDAFCSMPVRSKLMGLKPAGQPAAVEPSSRRLRRSLHEITRRRKIIWRHIERAERRDKANVDLLSEPLKIADDLPRNQQGDRVQGPGDRFGRGDMCRLQHGERLNGNRVKSRQKNIASTSDFWGARRARRAPGARKDPKGFQGKARWTCSPEASNSSQALAGLPLACATLCLRARWQIASSPSRLADSGAQMCATLAPGYASTTTRVPIGVF
jgi:hypothetical protein